MRLSRFIYGAAGDLSGVAGTQYLGVTLKPSRVRNKAAGRILARVGFWRRLWR